MAIFGKFGKLRPPPERILTRIYEKRRPEERLLVTPTGFKAYMIIK